MKNRYKLFIAFIFILLGIVSYQLYQINKFDGNLVIYTSNASEMDSVYFEVFLDNEKISGNNYLYGGAQIYTMHSLKTSLGHHKISVKVNGVFQQEYEVYILFMKLVIVDFYGDRYSDQDPFVIEERITPPIFL